MTTLPTTLYLHGGPGLNAAVERGWFGPELPILWWDQPRFAAETPAAFSATLDAAADQLEKLVDATGNSVNVIASSFGARLATELACCYPKKISALTLMAPVLSLETAFVQLAAKLPDSSVVSKAPRAASAAFQAKRSFAAYLDLVLALLAIPDLFSLYWAPQSAALASRHAALAASTEWFDLPTFLAVSAEVFDRASPVPPLGAPSTVRVIVGHHDPYADRTADFDLWRRLYPQAEISVVEGGHMLPFEMPIERWLGTNQYPASMPGLDP